ncbi:hypothetical protein MMC15_004677 [Xylographa vitiligo]|nr:hypothetical protein [Xylographa vitiligo]
MVRYPHPEQVLERSINAVLISHQRTVPNIKNWLSLLDELSLEEGVTIPEVLFSEQTYQYCGFTLAVAGQLWSRFQENIGKFPESDDPSHRNYFLSFAFARINRITKPSSFNDEEWVKALQEMGLNSTTQNVIMLENFSNIRRTESAAFWAQDTVDSRLGGLEDIRRASWERSQQGDRRRQRAQREERPSVDSTIPGMAVETARHAKQNAPGSIVLWKGLARYRTNGLFSPDNTVENFGPIQSVFPSDFSTSGWDYWPVDKEVAMQYADWAKNRDDVGGAVLLRLEVATNMIEPLQAPVLQYPSDLWKRFIHSCRRRRVPKELAYLQHQTLLIGHLGTGTTAIAKTGKRSMFVIR